MPDIATLLEKEVIVSSIFGTNTIEGGTLSQEETAALLDLEENAETKEEKERRVTNIRAAYGKTYKYAKTVIAAKAGAIHLQEIMITGLHATITDGLIHPRNIPG
ncbi:MAG: Fic family protein, partial [Gammaproteobacteria bacterium]